MYFKHEDTRLLIALTTAFLVLSGASWLLLGEGGVVVALALLLAVVAGLQLNLNRARQADDEQHLRHVQALLSLYALINIRAPLPALTGWAASPQLANTLVSLIRERSPRVIVECGSGASTVVMGYALEQAASGRVIALDHDAAYAAASSRQLARHQLQERAEVRHTPLRTVELDGATWQWYDTTVLPPDLQIDMLVVDGPPRETQPMARYPAVPLLRERLSRHAVIVLDDAHRGAEQQAAQRWMRAFPELELEIWESPKGTAVLRRGSRGGEANEPVPHSASSTASNTFE